MGDSGSTTTTPSTTPTDTTTTTTPSTTPTDTTTTTTPSNTTPTTDTTDENTSPTPDTYQAVSLLNLFSSGMGLVDIITVLF